AARRPAEQLGLDRLFVQVGAYRIPFHTEREGREYLRKLRERIEAPHALPGSPKPRIIRQAR
ncbi:hypothetical protein ACLBUN_33815, partial [Pseudomonas aeruginosa]|uniref:hypothetical protein n=1 Tax=Pseudomonas aeruginosa TaxID=287 RepID=UPI00396888C1